MMTTQNSLICCLIKDNPDTWESICKEKLIRVKKEEKYNWAVFNYVDNANFKDPVVREARGIIIDLKTNTVLCWPFTKFGNVHEDYCDSIDWSTARVQEKIDGSIIKAWYSSELNEWVWSSNAGIFIEDVYATTGRNFRDILESTDEFSDVMAILNSNEKYRDYTFIFELVSPDCRIVVKYDQTALCHLGVRNNLTGVEESWKLPIWVPREWPLHSLEECKEAVQNLNSDEFPDLEGFVVVDANWHRVKIKTPEYLLYHHQINNGKMDAYIAWEMLHSDDFNYEVFTTKVAPFIVKKFQLYVNAIEYAQNQIRELLDIVKVRMARGESRGEIVKAIKDNPYSYFGFKSMGSEFLVTCDFDYTNPDELMNAYLDRFLYLVNKNVGLD